jgi:glycosyltransferase involved in cell wall biosynthesis
MSQADVIIPCYKYGRYLPGCVASVLGQRDVDVRVLVIDDASPDDSAAVAARLAAQDRRIELRRHFTNRGHIETYNEGLDWADGEFVLLISADDLLAPGALARAVRLMEAHPEVGLTYGREIVFGDDAADRTYGTHETYETNRTNGTDGTHPTDLTDCPAHVYTGAEFLEVCCRTGSNPVATPTAIARTAVQKRVGGYRGDLPHTADLEMWLRFAAQGSVAAIDAEQAFKRVHGQNMQTQWFGTAIKDLEQRWRAFESFFGSVDGRVVDVRQLRAAAVRSLADEAFWTASRAIDEGDPRICRELLAFAVDVDPTVRSRPAWSRLRWKRRIGPRVWSVVRPWVERLRERRSTRAAQGA